MRLKIGILISIVSLFVLIGLVRWLMPPKVSVVPPTRLDVCFLDCVETYTFNVGEHVVTIEAMAVVAGDNGAANLIVYLPNGETGTIESYFDYDLFNDYPAGYAKWGRVDEDNQRDLIISLNDFRGYIDRYYISSVDGQLYPLEAIK